MNIFITAVWKRSYLNINLFKNWNLSKEILSVQFQLDYSILKAKSLQEPPVLYSVVDLRKSFIIKKQFTLSIRTR